jgi:hypothetical protein
MGFPQVTVNKIEEAHLAMSEGRFGKVELQELLDLIAGRGIVDFSERGSGRVDENGEVGDDPVARFSHRVTEYRSKDNLSFEDAFKLATKNHPEEFRAYQHAVRTRNVNMPEGR